MEENTDNTKYKKCPLNNFKTCIGEDCAFYDMLKLVEQDDDMAIFNFDCCSVAYLPYVFDKLKISVLHIEKLQQKIDKLVEK
jgi:hypothetical protein